MLHHPPLAVARLRSHVIARIGAGGQGAVYRAFGPEHGEVAIKILPRELGSHVSLSRRFAREARATAKIAHPNVVRILDVDRDEARGISYIVLELVAGQTLAQRVKSDGPFDWREGADLVRQAARGVSAAHAQGVIHRDLKPSNLMLTTDQQVKVMDFGLARLVTDESYLSVTGQVLGTPHYMAPEQARGLKGVDGRADVYGLGATLYHLITGAMPHPGATPALVMYHVVHEDPRPACEVNPAVPTALSGLIAQAMARDPDHRLPNVNALLAGLDAVLDGPGAVGGSPVTESLSTVAGSRQITPVPGAVVMPNTPIPPPLTPPAPPVVLPRPSARPPSSGPPPTPGTTHRQEPTGRRVTTASHRQSQVLIEEGSGLQTLLLAVGAATLASLAALGLARLIAPPPTERPPVTTAGDGSGSTSGSGSGSGSASQAAAGSGSTGAGSPVLPDPPRFGLANRDARGEIDASVPSRLRQRLPSSTYRVVEKENAAFHEALAARDFEKAMEVLDRVEFAEDTHVRPWARKLKVDLARAFNATLEAVDRAIVSGHHQRARRLLKTLRGVDDGHPELLRLRRTLDESR